jgi:hypothetical protein
MKAQPAVKQLSIISLMAFSITACSSNQEMEQVADEKPIISQPTYVEPVTTEETFYEEPEPEAELISAVINNGIIDIPVLENAQIFAEYSDSLPAVINYFTSSPESHVIDFYKQAFGEAYSQERQYGRLTLKYTQAQEFMRVVISQQDNKRQVDVIINTKS